MVKTTTEISKRFEINTKVSYIIYYYYTETFFLYSAGDLKLNPHPHPNPLLSLSTPLTKTTNQWRGPVVFSTTALTIRRHYNDGVKYFLDSDCRRRLVDAPSRSSFELDV